MTGISGVCQPVSALGEQHHRGLVNMLRLVHPMALAVDRSHSNAACHIELKDRSLLSVSSEVAQILMATVDDRHCRRGQDPGWRQVDRRRDFDMSAPISGRRSRSSFQ